MICSFLPLTWDTLCLMYYLKSWESLPNLLFSLVYPLFWITRFADFWSSYKLWSWMGFYSSLIYFLNIDGFIFLTNRNKSLFSVYSSIYSFKVVSYISLIYSLSASSIFSIGSLNPCFFRLCKYSLSPSLDLSTTTVALL